MSEVWGAEHETSDAAFRQLCKDTRTRFQTANCPLDVRPAGSGKVRLTRV
jgi:hypothetical protein